MVFDILLNCIFRITLLLFTYILYEFMVLLTLQTNYRVNFFLMMIHGGGTTPPTLTSLHGWATTLVTTVDYMLLCRFACCHWQLFLKAFVTFSGVRLLLCNMPTGICSVSVIGPLCSMVLYNCLLQFSMLHVCRVTIVGSDDQGGGPTV